MHKKSGNHSPLIGSKTQLQYLRSMPLPSPFEKFNKKYVLFLFFSSYLLTFACLNFFILCRSFLLHAMIPRNHFSETVTILEIQLKMAL